MAIDLERIRRDTPGTDHVLHFNNAGAALMPTAVIEAQTGHLALEAREGGYEAANLMSEKIDAVYDSIAALINAGRDEIAVVENATVAWDMAFYALAFRPGDRILTAEVEYAANYIAYLQVAKRTGAVVETIPSEPAGEVSVEALERMVDDRVRLISMTHVPTNGGLVNPAAEIGAVAKRHGITFLLDACQSVGQMPVDVQAIGCDILSATARKYLRGPRGAGFLYIRKGLVEKLEPPMIDMFAAEWVEPGRYELRKDARRFENWENNYAAKIGLGAAVDYARAVGLETSWSRLRVLADALRAGLSDIPGVSVKDIGSVKGGIVTFVKDGLSSDDIKTRLRAERVNVSVSPPSSTLLDTLARDLPPLVRASVHYYNSEDEVDRFLAAVRAL
ncbi:MAG: aminotransferase class V-fold PLP-dependent enzyme [Hyphomicrobiales bacterium]|nr:aminotransferase class V-fold PLP-dependent enzyme [Hyphomicrobiales bacterium]